jgi:hypothetical protein
LLGDTKFIEDEEWYGRLIDPIRNALYVNNARAADSALKRACAAADELPLTAEVREVLGYILRWYGFAAAIQGQPEKKRRQRYEEALELFSAPALTPAGEQQRCRMLAILRCTARLHGCAELTRDELKELIEDLPNLKTDEFLWHNIAGWAFANRDLEMLKRAFEVLLTHPSNLLGQAKWQRVNLMLQLTSGRATRQDVEFTVKGMAVLPQIIEFYQHIWPVCVAAGITDPELQQRLEETYARIRANPPVPGLEPRTKRIRGG